MESLPFIHILSDFDEKSLERSIYQAAVLREFPGASIVGSHQDFIKGDMMAPGIFLKLVLGDFPENCFHLCSLHIEDKLPEKHILAKYRGQHFLGPDNGFLPIALPDEETEYYKLPEASLANDLIKDIFIPTVKNILQNSFEFITEENPKKYLFPSPTITGNTYRLMVVYTDSEGNAYLNMQKKEFERITNGKSFRIRLSHKDVIDTISLNYHQVKESGKLALFGLGDMLQIALNCGSAAQYLGLKYGSIVMMEVI